MVILSNCYYSLSYIWHTIAASLVGLFQLDVLSNTSRNYPAKLASGISICEMFMVKDVDLIRVRMVALVDC